MIYYKLDIERFYLPIPLKTTYNQKYSKYKNEIFRDDD